MHCGFAHSRNTTKNGVGTITMNDGSDKIETGAGIAGSIPSNYVPIRLRELSGCCTTTGHSGRLSTDNNFGGANTENQQGLTAHIATIKPLAAIVS